MMIFNITGKPLRPFGAGAQPLDPEFAADGTKIINTSKLEDISLDREMSLL